MRKLCFIAIAGIFVIACQKKEKQPADYFYQQPLTTNEAQNAKLTPEILWKFGRVGESQLSPDGKWVVYTVKRHSLALNKGNAEIFKVSTEGGEPEQLSLTTESENSPKWILKSTKISYLSSKSGSSQLWTMNSDGSSKQQMSSIDGDIESYAFAPDGTHILFTMRVKTDTSAQDQNPDLPKTSGRVFTDLMYRHWDSWTDYKHSHIFVAKFENEKLSEQNDIMQGESFDAPLAPYFDASEICWSPDGKQIAYTSKKLKGKADALSTNSDIYLYNIETAKTTNLTEGMPGYDRSPVFSPDGKKLAWQSMATPGYESDKDRLMVLDLASGVKTNLFENFDQSAANIVWAEDASSIYFLSGIKATFQIYKLTMATGKIDKLTSGNHDYNAFSRVNNKIVGEKMSFSMAVELFCVDEMGKETQLTFTNKNIYDSIKMGAVKEQWITTTDNKQMLVWLVFPPNFDSTKKYPALLYCQGGPQSAVSQFFSYRWNLQLMAANGYIVIAPNRRGLPTFGSEWNDEIAGDYGGQNMKDYLSAVDEVKKLPYIDANKLGAVGASYGGFSVFYLAGNHQKRFKAFIAHCGMFNLESQYAETEEVFFTNHDLGGAYWNTPKPKSYDFSPHRFVQNWDTPIMIISGENDFRIPYTESLQAFNAAQLRGIPSKLLIFPDESHWVLKPQNSVLWQREFFGWLDKWLK